MNDPQGRDPNEMHRHYMTMPLYEGQTMGFPSPEDINLLVQTARHAALLMGYLYAYGKDIPGHIMDDDDNPGEYLRRDLRALGFWEDASPTGRLNGNNPDLQNVPIRLCKTPSNDKWRCSCVADDDRDCLTCGEHVWLSDGGPQHNCPPGFKK